MRDKTTPIYNLPGVTSKTPLDMLEKMLAIYSTYRTISGKGVKTLRPQLLKILAVYVMYGYNRESKLLAVNYCGFKDERRIDGLNKELRDAGYIVKDRFKEHDSHLNDDLQVLGEAFPKMMESINNLDSNNIKSLKVNIEVDLKFPI